MPTALLSVHHKDGIAEFGRQLHEMGWGLIASTGTRQVLREAELPALDVAALVGHRPTLNHRLVTLSSKVVGGLMSEDTVEGKAALKALRTRRIDLAWFSLYPFEDAVRGLLPFEQVIEMIDIGGCTNLMAAVKGGRIVVSDQADCTRVVDWLKNGRPDEERFLFELATKATRKVAEHYQAVNSFFMYSLAHGFMEKRS